MRAASRAVLAAAAFAAAPPAVAQTPVTRADAIAAALARGPRALLARADSAAAGADLAVARAFANPTLSAGYTKDIPRYHATLDLPLDWPWVRAPRVGAARAGAAAAGYRYAFARAAARFEADSAYTGALAAAAHARLSRADAAAADSLLRVARLRHAAGDASTMDVRLAEIAAGELANAAADDSLAALGALLDLQELMGLPADTARVTLADTLAPPDTGAAPAPATPLPVLAAEADLRAAERAASVARAANLPAPSLQVGVDNGDPTGQERGLLPTVGVAIALPLFSWNGGLRQRAAADRERAAVTLDATRRAAAADLAQAARRRALAVAKVARDGPLVASADSVAALFAEAYAEGAVSLPDVLEARRNARDVLARYVDDLALANTAAAFYRLLAAGAEGP